MQIHILHLRDRVFSFHPVIERTGHFLYARLASLLQDLIRLPLCKNIRRVGKIPLLQRLPVAHQEAAAFHPPGQAALRESAQQPPDPHRDLIKRSMLQRFTVNIISAEQLVRSLAREHDLHLLRRLFAQEEQGDRRRIRHRFIHIILDIRKAVPVFIRRDDLRVILHINACSEFLRILDLTVFPFIESNGECPVHLPQPGQVAGIHTAGKIGRHFHVADLVHPDRFLHHRLNVVNHLFKRLPAVSGEIRLEISGYLKPAVLICKIMPRLEAEYALEKCLIRRHKLE